MDKRFSHGIILFLAFIAIESSAYGAKYNATQTGRYSTVSNKASISQVNPLQAITIFKFPAKIQTVGDAVNIALQGTGYSLIDTKSQTKWMRATLTKTLPITVRTLGPIRVKDALVVLMGKRVFELVDDPLNREINFKIKSQFKKA